MPTYRAGTHIFSGVYCDEHLAQARAFIKENGFTSDDVRLVRVAEEGGQDGLEVIVRRDIP